MNYRAHTIGTGGKAGVFSPEDTRLGRSVVRDKNHE